MTLRSGSLLESDIERLFKLLSFKTQKNVRIKKYEIDVLAIFGNKKIAIECKQRDVSKTIDLRNLIHQWNSKNSIIKADKILLVIYGVKVNSSHKLLGRKFNIIIWDDVEFEKNYDLVVKDAKNARKIILNKLDLEISKSDIKEVEKKLSPFALKRQKILKEALQKLLNPKKSFFGKEKKGTLYLSEVENSESYPIVVSFHSNYFIKGSEHYSDETNEQLINDLRKRADKSFNSVFVIGTCGLNQIQTEKFLELANEEGLEYDEEELKSRYGNMIMFYIFITNIDKCVVVIERLFKEIVYLPEDSEIYTHFEYI